MRKLTVAVALVLTVAAVAYAGPRGKKYGKHTIHGMHYDKTAIEKLLDDSEVPAEVTADERGVRKLKGKFRLDKSMKVEDAAVDFIDRHRIAFKLKDPKNELKLRDDKPSWHMSLQQYYNGVPIWGHSIGIHLAAQDEIYRIQGNLIPSPDIDTTPLVTEEAVEIARADLRIPSDQLILPPERKLVIYDDTLAYKVDIVSWRCFINAKDGSIIFKENITMYD